MAHLILVRHGQSEWNKLGKWTGYVDVPLTEQGVIDAKKAGEALRGIPIVQVHTSALKRAQQTCDGMCQALKLTLPRVEHAALNEKSYGKYTGLNKYEVQKQIGDEAFHKIRRGWDIPVEEGETLKDVYERVVPYYIQHIRPSVLRQENVLVVAHGNSLRALMKYLEGISDEAIEHVEIGVGEVVMYTMDKEANVVDKEVRNASKAP